MSFDWPLMLLSLIFLPLAVLMYILVQRRRQKALARYSSLGLGHGLQRQNPGFRRHVPPALFLGGIALLMIALARPQAVINLPRVEGTVILAFDTSGSMAADDLKPSRMDAAKAAAHEFANRQPESVRIGVVAFSDSGFNVQSPTNNQESIHASIERLAPERGTSLAQGIIVSLNTIAEELGETQEGLPGEVPLEPLATPSSAPLGDFSSAIIILLTDGENNLDPDPLAAASAAAESGVRIYTIGVGSTAGATVNIDGFSVHTRLDEQMLRQITEVSGGAYYQAENEEDLRSIYDEINLQFVMKPEKMEVTSLLTGASVLILLAGALFSLIWFSRIP